MNLQENRSGERTIEETAVRVAHEVFGETADWCSLKKGMTNRSFVFTAGGERYIIRVPGEGTEWLINRKQEAEVYKTISGRGFCDDPVYLSPETGIKITKFLEHARTCEADDENDLRRCMALLKKLHTMKLQVPHTFDLYRQIDFYESLWDGKGSIYSDYAETKAKVFSLKSFIETHITSVCLSHIDAVPDNFLICGEDIQLTDWEYSGMQDPHIDIAMFCVYNDWTKEDVDRLIDIYFDGECSQATRVKIYCYISACGLLWSNWCEFKRHLEVEFGEYALRQYQYAADYYRIAVQEMKKL